MCQEKKCHWVHPGDHAMPKWNDGFVASSHLAATVPGSCSGAPECEVFPCALMASPLTTGCVLTFAPGKKVFIEF